MMERKERIIDEKEAASWIHDGMSVAIGGFINSLHPMAIVRHIIRNGVRNLTLIGTGNSGLDVDLLVGAGCVKKVITPCVTAEDLVAIGPMFRAKAQNGEIEVWECDEAIFYTGLRAAAAMLPFMPCRAGLGTSIPEINPDLKVFNDPINGEPLVAVPPIEPEVSILHAGYADAYGNIQHVGSALNDAIFFPASDKTIVEVDKIISNEDVRRFPEKTTIHVADAIVRAPYGAHPYASPGFHLEDREHIKDYVTAATAFLKENNRGPFESYLKKYIYEPETHADYLEVIGFKRLLSLYEY